MTSRVDLDAPEHSMCSEALASRDRDIKTWKTRAERAEVELRKLHEAVGEKLQRIHDLKAWPKYYEAIATGKKRFEIRLNDRGFEVGDVLMLSEWDPGPQRYTGKSIAMRVTFVLTSDEHQGLAEGHVALGIADTEEP